MNVLILDDEFFIRENIRDGIDWSALGIDEILECDNGAGAIELCRTRPISILISDIRMPGLNGIESIRQIRQFCPEIKIIFISGYPEKEYLKDAIRLQAVNFIEKPIDMKELFEILQEAVSDIHSRQAIASQIQTDSSLRLRYQKIRLAQDLTVPAANYVKLRALALETGFLHPSYTYLTLVVSFSSNFYEMLEQEFTDFIYDSWESLADSPFQIIAGFRNHYLLMHFSGELSDNDLYFKKRLHDFLQTAIIDALAPKQVTVRIGISRLACTFDTLKNAYEQACVAFWQAFYLPEGCCYAYTPGKNSDITSSDGDTSVGIHPAADTFAFPTQIIHEFQGYLLESRPDSILEKLNLIYTELQPHNNTLLSTVYHFYCQLGELLWSWCRQHNNTCFNDFKDKYQLLEHLQKLLYLRDLQSFFQNRLEKIIFQIDTFAYGNETVNAIARYISLHYSNPDLSITEISEEIHMVPNYIAGLFKKYTKVTINSYITSHRIAMAKNMLVTTEKSINDIAIDTGFRNPGYFSRVFFKYTYLTPSEYRRRQP